MIDNQAHIVTTNVGGERGAASNIVRLIVAERLDVALARDGTAVIAAGPQVVVPVLLTNGGSGSEPFVLSASSDDGRTHGTTFYVDRNGNGAIDADEAALADARTAALAPGAQLHLLAVVADVPAGTAIIVTATAATGSGAPGTTFAGQGDGGGDAVVGATGARASVTVATGTDAAAATLTKSQAVRDRRGGSVAEPGATVTYTLVAGFAAAATGAIISDPVPAGTTLVANSITLDGAALTDAADSDAGSAQDGAIRVDLGAQPAGATRTVTFQVVIQ